MGWHWSRVILVDPTGFEPITSVVKAGEVTVTSMGPRLPGSKQKDPPVINTGGSSCDNRMEVVIPRLLNRIKTEIGPLVNGLSVNNVCKIKLL